MRLYNLHSRGLAATFADLENQAIAQGKAPLATPGSVLERTNAGGFRFYALQQYDHESKRRESYLAGPVGDAAAEEAAAQARKLIEEQRDIVKTIRLLVREGYLTLERKHYLAIAALANHGFFAGGGVLVGSHAFEAVLNGMGVRASGFPTTDVDIARPSKLQLAAPGGGLLGILRSSGMDFQDIPNSDPRDPPIKIKEKGRSRFTVDLLAPTREPQWGTLYVPELKAHALTPPYLQYLVSETQSGTVISSIGCAAVRVPVPEKFAMHKLLVSRLRRTGSEKSRKDQRQAAIVIAALAELHPGACAEAFAKTPTSARSKILASMTETQPLLADHPQAIDEVGHILAKRAR